MSARKYKLTLFSSEYPPNIFGGLGVHVNQITAALAQTITYDLFLPKHGNYLHFSSAIHQHEIAAPAAKTSVEFWLRFCQMAAKAARRIVKTTDLINCHDWMTIFAGVKSRGFLKKPLVFNVHLPQLPGPSFHLENLGLVAADLVIVNSEAMREQLIAREVPIRQIEVVPNGVDAATFSPAPDWPVDDGYILFVGRLVEQKGIDTLLKAFGVVLHQCADARLVIAGDGELELYLKRLIRNLGFPHRVSFVNWQTGPALVKLYQRAQVVVVPSYFEPFGMVALEAMACGRPVIASSVGGLKEIIEDDVQGYLVPTGDYLQLAQRLAHLILNPARRQEMGKAARIHASRFTWDAIGAKIVNLYEDLLGKAIMLDDQEIIFRQRDELLSWLENYAGRVEANWPSLLDLEKF